MNGRPASAYSHPGRVLFVLDSLDPVYQRWEL